MGEAEVTNEYIMEAEVMEEKVDIYNKKVEKLYKTERVTVLTVAMKIGKTDVNIRTANGVLHTVPWRMWDNHFKLLGPHYPYSNQYMSKDVIPEEINENKARAETQYKKTFGAQSVSNMKDAKTFVGEPDLDGLDMPNGWEENSYMKKIRKNEETRVKREIKKEEKAQKKEEKAQKKAAAKQAKEEEKAQKKADKEQAKKEEKERRRADKAQKKADKEKKKGTEKKKKKKKKKK